MTERELLNDKKRIVIKIGSSSLTHAETGDLNLAKIEKLVRIISDMRGMGKEVILVSSGAIATGRQTLGGKKPETVAEKQAYAAVGQARLMMVYQKLFSEYNQTAAQILITKATILDDTSRTNAKNTFNELLKLGTVPIVNENDTVSTYEIKFGDNDRLSAIVAALVEGDLLFLLSDIDGLYTDDPKKTRTRSSSARWMILPMNLWLWVREPQEVTWEPVEWRRSSMRQRSRRRAEPTW